MHQSPGNGLTIYGSISSSRDEPREPASYLQNMWGLGPTEGDRR